MEILGWVYKKQGVYFAKINPKGTSQTCPNCRVHTGKKKLGERVHNCSECGYTTDQDVAVAIVVEQRGLAEILGCGFASPKDFQENSCRTDGNAGCGG